jgi:hypothetical protein
VDVIGRGRDRGLPHLYPCDILAIGDQGQLDDDNHAAPWRSETPDDPAVGLFICGEQVDIDVIEPLPVQSGMKARPDRAAGCVVHGLPSELGCAVNACAHGCNAFARERLAQGREEWHSKRLVGRLGSKQGTYLTFQRERC